MLKKLLIAIFAVSALPGLAAEFSEKRYPLQGGLVLRVTGIPSDLYRQDDRPPEATIHYTLVNLDGTIPAPGSPRLRDFYSRNRLPLGSPLAQADLTPLLPGVLLRYLGVNGLDLTREPVLEAENCLGAVMAFFKNSKVAFSDEGRFGAFLADDFVPVPLANRPLRFGDVLRFSREVHAAVMLFDGYVFQKPSLYPYHAYEIVPLTGLFDTLNATIEHLNRHPIPDAGYFHASTSYVFNLSMSGATPLPVVRWGRDGALDDPRIALFEKR